MDWLISLDESALTFVNSTLSHPWLDVFFPLITDLHKSPLFVALALPSLLAVLLNKYGRKGGVLFLGLVICVASNDAFCSQLLKNNFQRPRPFATSGLEVQKKSPAGGFSFPSNHAANTFAIAAFLSTFFPAAAPWFFSFALLVCYSRIYNGVHFPSDVLTGALIGYLFGWGFSKGLVRWLPTLRGQSA